MNEKLVEFENRIKTKRVTVIGIGISNLPLIKYLRKLGAEVTACDKRTADKLGENYFELEKNKYTNVRIDYKVSGIGSDSCGPHLAERYQMNDKEIRFNYLIKKND